MGKAQTSKKERIQRMKKFEDQLMKFTITKDKLKMEIKLSDLEWLLRASPENVSSDGEHEHCRVKRGKRQEFAEGVVKMLLDEAPHERDCMRWGEPFEDIFMEFFEGYEDFLKYYDEE